MKKTKENHLLLSMLFVSILIIANIISIKSIFLFNINNTAIVVPASAFLFIFTFFISNIIVYLFGVNEAKELTQLGIICQMMCSIIFIIVDMLPANSADIQTAYHSVLGNNAMFLIGSVFAYECSQKLNICIFNKICKSKFCSIANFISLAISQIVDDMIFIGIGFGIGLQYLFHADLIISMLIMILSQYIIKLILSLILTPIFNKCVKLR